MFGKKRKNEFSEDSLGKIFLKNFFKLHEDVHLHIIYVSKVVTATRAFQQTFLPLCVFRHKLSAHASSQVGPCHYL